MSFFTRTNRPVTKISPIGDGTAPVYEELIDDDGRTYLKQTGTDNLFEFVQASKDETDIYHIINRYERGDVTALNQRTGQYIDVVGMPTNFAEAQQRIIDLQNRFDALTPEAKAKFNNDVNVFIEQLATGSYEVEQVTTSTDVKDGDDNVA